MNEDDLSLEIPRWVWPLVVLALVFTAWAALYILFGAVATAPVVVAAMAAFGLWMCTTYRQPRARRILPLHIALAIVLVLQGAEQWALGYTGVVAGMFPAHFQPPVVWNADIHVVAFTLLSTFVFLVAGVGVFFHHPLGNYGACFLMATAVVGSLWLFAMPMAAGEARYVPGMGMASCALVLGALGTLRLLRARVFNGVPA